MRLALVGDPVGHSRSPAIHTAALAACGIVGTYEARTVDADGAATAVDDIRRRALHGLNATMPHKEVVAGAADVRDELVTRAGVANTLWHTPDGVAATNTDVAGILAAWSDAGLPGDAPVVVHGAGGAAAAALLALEGRSIVVHARRPSTAVALVARLGVVASVVDGPVGRGFVLVNATPVGMGGEALPEAFLEGAVGLFDMAYGGGPTPAVAWATEAGLPVADGLDMLVAQAARSFEIWTGHDAPVDVMRSAARAG